jgi:8-oxo-dGTP pyrophosphatase MutT (NUDIX family)
VILRIFIAPADSTVEPRRAAVALIIRVVPGSSRPPPEPPRSLNEFFELDWVKDPNATAEILFLRRDKPSGPDAATDDRRPSSAGEAHVAFPGGRMEDGDEGGLYTG